MNNKQFVNTLAEKCERTPEETQTMLNTVMQVMTRALTNGDSVQINNLGTFEVRQRKEKLLVNPTTKQKMLIPPKLVLTFKPQSQLKQQYNNSSAN